MTPREIYRRVFRSDPTWFAPIVIALVIGLIVLVLNFVVAG